MLEELRTARDQAIPDRLLERAYGIAVIPDMTKVAFFAGGRHGHGVLVVRDSKGRFGDPVFISMTGGSFGWQWGVQSTDIVLVFTTAKGVEGISGGKVTLGADASVAAGPVGRQASAATDPSFKAEVYSYSRSRGVFAGLALDGTVISIDDDADAASTRSRRCRRRHPRGSVPERRRRGPPLHDGGRHEHRHAAFRVAAGAAARRRRPRAGAGCGPGAGPEPRPRPPRSPSRSPIRSRAQEPK